MPETMYPEDDVIPSPTDEEVIVLFYFLGIFSPPFKTFSHFSNISKGSGFEILELPVFIIFDSFLTLQKYPSEDIGEGVMLEGQLEGLMCAKHMGEQSDREHGGQGK